MYCTVNDIEARIDPRHLAELADDNRDGLADTATIEAAIADADALIDTHLRARYAVPFDPAPDVLRRISCDLALSALFARRREADSPVHRARAQDAVRLLEAIARGEILLAESGLKGKPESTALDDDKTFSRDSLDAF